MEKLPIEYFLQLENTLSRFAGTFRCVCNWSVLWGRGTFECLLFPKVILTETQALI